MKSFPEDSSSHPIIPPDHRCVWMAAGILSYQLCDREFDCDNCPLDAALQMHFSRGADHQKTRPPARNGNLAEDQQDGYRYSANHCWVKVVDENVVRVGLEPKLACALLSPKAIAMPSTGDTVRVRESCCWVILEGGTIPLGAPVDGMVCSVNAAVCDQPYRLCTNPYTHGWLFEIQLQGDALSTAGLLSKSEADRQYAEDCNRFNKTLLNALKSNKMSVGATLADGGQALHDVSQMLGPKRYFELVKSVFCP